MNHWTSSLAVGYGYERGAFAQQITQVALSNPSFVCKYQSIKQEVTRALRKRSPFQSSFQKSLPYNA